jgi:hypothetical protein
MLAHKKLVASGDYDVAQILLRLLVRHEVVLGYGDDENRAERILDKMGCVICYVGRWNMAHVHDWGRM